ncbi:hypothetical protein SAMN06295912_10145 [Sphingomonas laterariae]|uniref:Uncharacterized protein n=1 Tax=Edaphosphingomonas laterariae TaxID=861865 RepID=A0A239BDP0_9SPHN|nr:hypothetical protein [Sphingomonas laterariae]SNS05204.1 hypothetical protein SAMN06295912_10145 [Sphingomonas laterariae]
MYAFVDRPVTDLGNGDRFALWAMRAWVYALGEGRCPARALGPAFAQMGVSDALADFHATMAILNRQPREKLALAPLGDHHIAEDEAILLALWAAAATGEKIGLQGTLKLMVDVCCAATIWGTLERAAPKLAALDLIPSGVATTEGNRP